MDAECNQCHNQHRRPSRNALLRSKRKVHIPGIPIRASNTRARKWTVPTCRSRSTHAALPSPLRYIDRLTCGCGFQREDCVARGAGRGGRGATTLLDCAGNAAADGQKGNVDTVVVEGAEESVSAGWQEWEE